MQNTSEDVAESISQDALAILGIDWNGPVPDIQTNNNVQVPRIILDLPELDSKTTTAQIAEILMIYQDQPKALCGSNNLTPTEATPENQMDAEEKTSDQQEDKDNSESEDEEEAAN